MWWWYSSLHHNVDDIGHNHNAVDDKRRDNHIQLEVANNDCQQMIMIKNTNVFHYHQNHNDHHTIDIDNHLWSARPIMITPSLIIMFIILSTLEPGFNCPL